MYRGFNLEEIPFDETLYNKGQAHLEVNQVLIEAELSKYIQPNGILNASLMEANWFPQIDADIFISHSHRDRNGAITLAGWLAKNFGLSVFIDSTLWGSSNRMLRDIDNVYCWNEQSRMYDYNIRNRTTSHVHLMLSTALMKMIDKTECIFFLNTPRSITTDSVFKDTTKSPWLYAEIAMTQLVRKKRITEYRKELLKSRMDETFSITGDSFEAEFSVSLDHLEKLSIDDLKNWLEAWSPVSLHNKYPLDFLYNIKSITANNRIND